MNSPRNLAARAGRWSARHPWKAIITWFAFVIAAVVIGGSIGTQTLTDEEYGVGESGAADKVIADAFPNEENETVLVQSDDGLTARIPSSAPRSRTSSAGSSRPRTSSRSRARTRPRTRATISEDGRSALVTF